MKDEKTGIDKKLKAQVVRYIRQLFRQAESFRQAKENAVHPTIRGPRGGKMYQCCECKNPFKATEIQVDQIEPIVSPGVKQADMTIDEYVDRLFCDVSNLQILCFECHKEKSQCERKQSKLKVSQDR